MEGIQEAIQTQGSERAGMWSEQWLQPQNKWVIKKKKKKDTHCSHLFSFNYAASFEELREVWMQPVWHHTCALWRDDVNHYSTPALKESMQQAATTDARLPWEPSTVTVKNYGGRESSCEITMETRRRFKLKGNKFEDIVLLQSQELVIRFLNTKNRKWSIWIERPLIALLRCRHFNITMGVLNSIYTWRTKTAIYTILKNAPI